MVSWSIGPITIYVWGFFVAVGWLVAALVSVWRARQTKADAEHVWTLSVVSIVGALLGGKLAYVLWHPTAWQQLLQVRNLPDGGFVFYGGLVGAVLATSVYVWFFHLSWRRYADIAAPGIALGIAIGRIGCTLIADEMGRITTSPFGVYYLGNVRHNTALYEVAAMLVCGLVMLYWPRLHKLPVGMLWYALLLWYGGTRAWIDGLRATDLLETDPRLFGFTYSQYISILVVLIAAWHIKRIYAQQSRKKT